MNGVRQGPIEQLTRGPRPLIVEMIDDATTGHLLLMGEEEGEARQELVYVQAGAVVACSSLLDKPVRQVLVEQGLLDPAEVQKIESRAVALNRPDIAPEQLLIDAGRLSMDQIVGAMAAAVRRVALAAINRTPGLFTFKPLENAAPPRTLARLWLRDLAATHARRVSAPGEQLASLDLAGARLRLAPNVEGLRQQVAFQPNEWKLLFRLSEPRTLDELRALVAVAEAEFDRVLYGMVLAGAVLVDRPAPLPTRAELAAANAGKRRVLVVDDSQTMRELVVEALAPLNVVCEQAADGYEALRLAEDNRPDVVLLDVVMPGMDGYKVCSELREKFPGEPALPIVMLTAKDGTFSLIRGKLSGASNYITKPFDAEQLRLVVEGYLT